MKLVTIGRRVSTSDDERCMMLARSFVWVYLHFRLRDSRIGFGKLQSAVTDRADCFVMESLDDDVRLGNRGRRAGMAWVGITWVVNFIDTRRGTDCIETLGTLSPVQVVLLRRVTASRQQAVLPRRDPNIKGWRIIPLSLTRSPAHSSAVLRIKHPCCHGPPNWRSYSGPRANSPTPGHCILPDAGMVCSFAGVTCHKPFSGHGD